MNHVVISMNTNSPHFLNERRQALVLCAKIAYSIRIVSSCYLQKSWLDNYQNLCYKQFLEATENEKLLLWTHSLWTFCAIPKKIYM